MKSNTPRGLVLNILVGILGMTIFFGSLEIYSRFRYFNGTRLVEKGFTVRNGFVRLKKTTPVRIICLGGSTTYGYYAEQPESYPAYLEQLINKRLDRRLVEVLNGGLPKKDTRFFKEYVKKHVREQEFDIATIDCVYNNFGCFFPFWYDPVKSIKLVRDNRWRTLSVSYKWENFNLAEVVNMWLTAHSYFYSRLREKLMLITHKGKTIGEIYQEKLSVPRTGKEFVIERPDIQEYDVSSDENLRNVISAFMDEFRSDIKEMVSTFKANKIDVVLVMPPYPYFEYTVWKGKLNGTETSDELYRCIFDDAKSILKAIAADEGLLFIDNDDGLTRKGRSADMFYDAIHLSPKGNLAVAENMRKYLVPYLRKKYKLALLTPDKYI